MSSWNESLQRLISFAVLASAVSLSCTTMGKEGKRLVFAEELRDARSDIDRQNYAQAIRGLDMLLAIDPEQREARFMRARALHAQGSSAEALDEYQALIASDPDDPKPYYNVGLIAAFELNDAKKALAAFDHFLTIAPEHEKAPTVVAAMQSLDAPSPEETLQLQRAEYFIAEEKDEEAILLLEELLSRHPTHFKAHLVLGKLQQRRGKKEAAALHLKKAALFSRFVRL